MRESFGGMHGNLYRSRLIWLEGRHSNARTNAHTCTYIQTDRKIKYTVWCDMIKSDIKGRILGVECEIKKEGRKESRKGEKRYIKSRERCLCVFVCVSVSVRWCRNVGKYRIEYIMQCVWMMRMLTIGKIVVLDCMDKYERNCVKFKS